MLWMYIVVILTAAILSFDVVMYRTKGEKMRKNYIAFASVLSAVGVVGVWLARFTLSSRLTGLLDTGGVDGEFIFWALKKIDDCAIITVAAAVIGGALLLRGENRKTEVVCRNFGKLTAALMAGVAVFCIWFTIGAANETFDISAYIGGLCICEIFAMHILLVIKKRSLGTGK